MSQWRIHFEMRCLRDGQQTCKKGKVIRAFGLMDSPEKPTAQLAKHFIEVNLYYCSSQAERHFVETKEHDIQILEIESGQHAR